MSDRLIRQSLGQGVHFNSIRDAKFKHNRLTVYFILPLEAENASDNAVVPFLLRKGSRTCPDFSSLNARLSELYGATLDAEVSKFGGHQLMEVSIKGLDNRYALDGEDVTGLCAQLLADVVLDPKLDSDGMFLQSDVELERQYVVDSIEAEVNEKRSYALAQCIRTMCAGEPVSVRRYGDAQTAAAITRESATAAWKRMTTQARVEILFTGSGDPGSARSVFETAFSERKRSPIPFETVRLRTSSNVVREKVERMDISQGKLVLGMRAGKIEDSIRDINALRLFAAVYGGTPFSKLFMNVREKLSLCYYCAARFDVSTRLVLVDSGVEFENRQKAQDEILTQLRSVQDGDFTDDELASAKLLMKNSITSSGDSLSSLEGWYLSQILRGQDLTPEQDAAAIDQVTREQVVQAARAVTLDTIYFLTGNETNGEEAQ